MSKFVQTATLIAASPALLGCGCLVTPVIIFIVLMTFTALSISFSHTVQFLVTNKTTVLAFTSIAFVITGGAILFKYFSNPESKDNE